MCAAVDMLSSEQHFYGVSPPAGFLSDYTPSYRRPPSRGFSSPCFPINKPIQLSFRNAQRSCLKIQAEKPKKRVVFADDKGLALEHVRFMTEPSHIPPFWTLKIVSSPPAERKTAGRQLVDIWQLKFEQPSSNYVEFHRRIKDSCVSVDNVVIKQEDGALDGIVRVKNLDFAKEVLVRSSADGWRTQEDTVCLFLAPQEPGASPLYDTFSFRLQLPAHSQRLVFCVCFKCLGTEHWDNNAGSNYVVERSSVKTVKSIARVVSGPAWSSETDVNGNTPYW